MWPLLDTSRWRSLGALSASSNGTALTAGSANAKGSWVQLSSALPFDSSFCVVATQPPTGADCLIDLGLGAASSELVVAANLSSSSGTGAFGRSFYRLPLILPAGERLSARCQCTTGAATVRIAVMIAQQGLAPVQTLGRLTTYGANTADSGGTSVDPGGSANAKGSWTQITAATTNRISALVVAFGNQVNTARADSTFLFDIGIGAGGSEVVLIPNLWTSVDLVNDSPAPFIQGPFPVAIPAGTRIAVRAACQITDATDRLLDVLLYGCD